jgi:type I protein arginine methyltransferase
MLMDDVRTSHYRNAIINNKQDFQDKIVMDVGAGSGILSLFAAQAGARKVYAIEASNMAESARALIEANGFS